MIAAVAAVVMISVPSPAAVGEALNGASLSLLGATHPETPRGKFTRRNLFAEQKPVITNGAIATDSSIGPLPSCYERRDDNRNFAHSFQQVKFPAGQWQYDAVLNF